ncbi:MAG: ribosome biogenesis GTPase Der [Patescibacteria group bacterium]
MNQPHNLYPKVVLIGRTNVGKSTLFNRLTDTGRAIVSPHANTTRDQNQAVVHWQGSSLLLVDTGGLDMAVFDPLDKDIQAQVAKAVKGAAAVIFVVDNQADVMPQDRDTAKWLQRLKIPVIVCINKAESLRTQQAGMATFAVLPFADHVACSAKNGSGTGDLLDLVFSRIPVVATRIEDQTTIQVAIVGQPNVGKSTLFNGLIGEDLVIVSPLPHTTRDPHDTLLSYNGHLYNLIDTAGMRRKTKVGSGDGGDLERLSVNQTKAMIAQADVVLCVIEAQRRITHQDKAMLDYIKMKGKSFILVVNKWDLIPNKTASTINDYMRYYGHQFDFSTHTPITFISALEKQRTTQLLDITQRVFDFQNHWMEQAELDGVVRQVLYRQPKERRQGYADKPKRKLDLQSLTQTSINPPRFLLQTPRPKNVPPAIIHIVENLIREHCSYEGVPIYLEVRAKE